jgi:transposase
MRFRFIKKAGRHFSVEDQHKIIQEMISSGCTKREIWKKYTGQDEEKGQLLRWMKKLGYANHRPKKKVTLNQPTASMGRKSKVQQVTPAAEQNMDQLQLQKRIFELEKQLKDAELKVIAFSTMVDIAEKEFKIPIRKKFNTKPLKK